MWFGKLSGVTCICVSDIFVGIRSDPQFGRILFFLYRTFWWQAATSQAQKFSYEKLYLIPKLKCHQYCGIVLLEVMYNVISMIIHILIQFHPAPHGFCHKCGTCTYIFWSQIGYAMGFCTKYIWVSQKPMICWTINVHCHCMRLTALGLRPSLFLGQFGNRRCWYPSWMIVSEMLFALIMEFDKEM